MGMVRNAVGRDPGGKTNRSRTRRGGGIRAGLSIAVLFCAICPAQNTQNRPPGYWPDHDTQVTPVNQRPDANAQMERGIKKAQTEKFEAANAERKRQLEADSALLLQLATELDTELARTAQDALSPLVIEKIEAIEKLAHTVKEKMKLTVAAS